MEEIETQAIKFATKYLSKKDLLHSLRVAEYAAELSPRDIDKKYLYAIGVLHDTIEDSNATVEDLEADLDNFSTYVKDKIVNAVILLTHNEEDSYKEYVEKIINSKNEYAYIVKKADIKDHLTLVDTLTDKRLAKYGPILHYFI